MTAVKTPERTLKVGDIIKCHDKDDMINTSTSLAQEDIMTDFMYEKDGKQGLWLIVVDHY